MQISLSKRVRARTSKSGPISHTRYVLDFKDPATGRRRQEFFVRKADAAARREELVHRPSAPVPAAPEAAQDGQTVQSVLAYWLESLPQGLKESTRHYYHQMARYVLYVTPIGTRADRRRWSRSGTIPPDVATLPGLGEISLEALSAPAIRTWHAGLVAHVGHCTARGAKKVLGSALRLAAEELNLRVPPLPRTTSRRRGEKQKKRTLSVHQVAILVRAALEDHDRGLYYAFPFLTGVRPSEQLGLLWSDVDFEKGCLAIKRMQELDGTLCTFTKTEASTREIPMPPLLRSMLLQWRSKCPNGGSASARVFATQGSGKSRRHARAGAPLSYYNFRQTYWYPALRKLGLPNVAPHSARHTFISTLQAEGTEVGLVAKLAGHANPNITLSYYTQAVRDGTASLQRLERLFLGTPETSREGIAG